MGEPAVKQQTRQSQKDIRWMRTTRTLVISLLAAFAARWRLGRRRRRNCSGRSEEPRSQRAMRSRTRAGASKLYSSLEKGVTPIVIECKTDTSGGLILPAGIAANVATFEGCAFVAPIPTPLIEKCTVASVQPSARDSLVYSGSAIRDLFEPLPGSTVFAVVTITGPKCSIAGQYNVTGSVLVKIGRENKQEKTCVVTFATVKGESKGQESTEYKETEKGAKNSCVEILGRTGHVRKQRRSRTGQQRRMGRILIPATG
jgi:hypothetical protein